MTSNRRNVLRYGAATAFATVVGGPATAAARGPCDVLVDASGGGDATTVQGGVDAASPGDTVCVADGTYTEHVHVETDLTLTSAPGASPTIEFPADPPNYTIPESGNSWEVGLFVGPETGDRTVQVDVSGITVDGADQQPNDAQVAAGVLLRNVDGSVTDVTVVDMAVGGKQTGGVAVYGDADVSLRRNTVDGYERFGIVANGDGEADPAPTVDVRRNQVTGSGDGSETAWGPNGIQVGYGADGTVERNRVDRNRYSPSSPIGSGIIVFESDDVTVANNTVTDCDAALACGTWSWFHRTANNNRFVGNEVDGSIVGVYLESVAWDGFTTADPTLVNTKVVNNRLTQGGIGSDPTADSVGVELATADGDPDYEPVLDDTKVIRNDIEGFGTAVADGGTDTKRHANAFEP